MHRRHHLYRIPAGCSRRDHALSRRFQKIDVPGAQRRADRVDPARPEEPLRRAPQRAYSAAALSAAAELSAHRYQRPPPAGQGHRRHRRGRRGAAAAAALAAEEGHRQGRDRAIVSKITRIPPQRCPTTTAAAGYAGPRSQDRGVRPGRGHRRADRRHQRWRVRAGKPDKPIGAFLFSGSTGWARPKWRASSRSPWASSCCASTCPSTWSAMPSRA